MEPCKTTIDGFTFELHQLPAWQHAEASLNLMKIVGPAITPLAKLFAKQNPGSSFDMEVVGAVIQVMRNAPTADVMGLARTMLEGGGAVIGGDLDDGKGKLKLAPLMPIFDRVLRGKLLTIYKLIGWAVVVNFSGFFDDLKNVLPSNPAARPSPESPSTSTSPNPLVADGPAAA